MTDKDALKRQHERAAGERLVAWLSQQSGDCYEVLDQPDPPAPDLIISNGQSTIGVEVATAYYSEDEARFRWSWARGNETQLGMAIVNPDEKLGDFVQSTLQAKCAKRYAFKGPIWLLIDARPPLTTERDIDGFAGILSVPDDAPFATIYLGVDLPISLGQPTEHEGKYRVWKLHPGSGDR